MMKFKVLLILLYLISNGAFAQVFVLLDNDTHEFIEEVDYTLFKDRQPVYKGVTSADKATNLDQVAAFDSISFSRVDYDAVGFLKKDLGPAVYLSKKIIHLDELIIVNNKEEEIVLGEKNRFLKRQSRPISNELAWGTVFINTLQESLQLNKIVFYTANVTYKTSYKINFSEVKETTPSVGHQFVDPGNLVYSTDALFLDAKDKSKVEVALPPDLSLPPNKPVLVWIQLINYYDKEGAVIDAGEKDKTKIKFQLSKRADFYSKTYNLSTKETSLNLINVNVMINYDFATMFYSKPHKSALVAPAILLHGAKLE